MELKSQIPLHVAFPCNTLEIALATTQTLLHNAGCTDKHAVRVLLQTIAPAITDITKQFKEVFRIPDEVANDERASMCLVGLFSASLKQVLYWGFKSMYWLKCQFAATALKPRQLTLNRHMCAPVDVTTLRSRWMYGGIEIHHSFDWSNGDLLTCEPSQQDLKGWLDMRLDLLEGVALARQITESKAGSRKSLLQAIEETKLSDSTWAILCPTSKKGVRLDSRSLYCWRLVWTVFSSNSETRRELVDRWRMLEMDLFTIRSSGCAKQHVPKLANEIESATQQTIYEMHPTVQAQCRALDPVCIDWLALPFEKALRAMAQHRCVLHKGVAYIPANSIQDIARERYSQWLRKLVDTQRPEYKNLYALVQSDKRIKDILREFVGKFYHRLAPSVRSNSNIGNQDLNNLAITARRSDSWMPPCMQQLGTQQHLKNTARITYGHYLLRRGATLAQVRQHFLPKFEHAYPPQQFVKEWRTIRNELDWNFKHKMRNEATCDRMMSCSMCPLNTGSNTNKQQAKMQCAELAKKRNGEKQGQAIVRAPRDFSVFVLSK